MSSFGTQSLTAMELTAVVKLAGQVALRTLLSLCSHCWDYKRMLPHLRAFPQGSWGIELVSLCLHGNTLATELSPQSSALPLFPSNPCGNRYVYGKPVQGVAYTRFALMDEQGKKSFLRGLETQTKVG